MSHHHQVVILDKRFSINGIKATSLENGACPTNVAGSSKYTAISGATSATYTPGAITQTTCYIRTARRTNCNDYVAESNAVLVVLKNNCSTVACTNNIVTNSSFETDDNVTNNGKKFPVYFQSSPASYITRTATNTDAYRGASPADWAIGTDVNDYANQNGAYYIDASVTGNANSGDRFIYGRYNQCVLFAPSANQKFFPVTPGKNIKYVLIWLHLTHRVYKVMQMCILNTISEMLKEAIKVYYLQEIFINQSLLMQMVNGKHSTGNSIVLKLWLLQVQNT
jgi:hypothetical protein